MKSFTKRAGGIALVSLGALFCFSLVVFFSTKTPGSAQTAFADTPATTALSPDSVSFLESMQKANRGISSLILPSVVTLDVKETKTVDSNSANNMPFFFYGTPQQGDNGDGSGSGQQRQYDSEGLGSGIIVRNTGKTFYVLTNQHVAGAASEIMVQLNDGREFSGKLVGGDERKDIALVSFESDDKTIPVAKLGDSDAVQPGDIVFAVGSPLGYMASITQGIVSALGRQGPNDNINDFIQTDAAINQGNSGGPLVNIKGEVIGVNAWIASNTGGSQGLGFSIPINNVKKAIDDFISSGKVIYGWLGVSLVEPDKDTLASLGLTGKKGALAQQLFVDSPADKGGIQPGDFVVALDGKDVKNVDQLVRDVGDIEAGQTVTFGVMRNGKAQDVKVKITQRDANTVSDSSKLWPGFSPYPMTDQIRTQLKLDKKQKGFLVIGVQAKSAAAIMGLQSGDVVVKMNDKDVADLSDFYARLSDRSSKEIWFEVIRDGQTVSTLKYKR